MTQHLSDSEVAAFLAPRHDDPGRDGTLAHLAECDECRQAVIEVDDLVSTYLPARTRQTPPAGGSRNRRLAVLASGLIAASIATFAFVADSGDRAPVTRGAPAVSTPDRREVIEVISPAESEPVAGGPVLFSWKHQPADFYRITIYDDDGVSIVTRETPDTAITIDAVSGLRSPGRYLWRVDAVRGGIEASSGVRPLTLGR